MSINEIYGKLANCHLQGFNHTLTPYNNGDTYTITVKQESTETFDVFIERATRIKKRLGLEFIVIGSEENYQDGYSSEIEFTYGLE